MVTRSFFLKLGILCLTLLIFTIGMLPPLAIAADFPSHPPMRALPQPSPPATLPENGVFYVDGKSGNDAGSGSRSGPWKSIQSGVDRLRPGDTLVLRGGVYHGNVRVTTRGTAEQPVTIRSHPGELAILDGGIPEFLLEPGNAWEEVGNGEFRSVRSYPGLGTIDEGHTNLLGNFADSMIPLHGYRFITDLRSDNHLFNKLEGDKTAQGNGLYCGPGLFYDVASGRIHIRLAPTKQPALPAGDNYAGETDPRKLPLIIAGHGESPLMLEGASHLRIEDIAVRGAREGTINIENSSNITLSGVTSYGGSSALRVETTGGLRCVNCAFRGIAAPWLWRWSLKYRSIEARIVAASSWNPPARLNRDFEFSFCEFTDCVDGVFIGNVEDCRIHHCLLDNITDDGIFLTCRTGYDGSVSGSAEIDHNRISRVLTAFAYGVGHGRQKALDKGRVLLGGGVFAHHNVFDFREPVQYQEPEEGPITTYGRVGGDHGSPGWEPLIFEQNTLLAREAPWRNYYAAGWGSSMGKGTSRKVRGNVFRHQSGMPGEVLPAKGVDFAAENNVHWSDEAGNVGGGAFLKKFRSSPLFSETGWTRGDLYSDPDKAPPGVGAGPDIPVGQFGRHLFHGGNNGKEAAISDPLPFRHPASPPPGKRAALVLGYPAFDAPLLQYALEKNGAWVEVFDRAWLPAERFGEYDLVAVLGNTVRAKMEPSGFSESEFAQLTRYLQQGGNLIIGRELGGMLFPGDRGKAFAETLFGKTAKSRDKPVLSALEPEHPWISHFSSFDWLKNSASAPIFLGAGRNLIGDAASSRSSLADIPIGKGRLIYVGWDIARFLPEGRKASTPKMEADYENQYRIYEAMVRDLL